MTRLLPLLLLAMIAGSCSTRPRSGADLSSPYWDSLAQKAAPRTPVTPSTRPVLLDTVIPFPGFWVNEHYIHNVRLSLSPRSSQDTATLCIVIPPRTLQVTRWISGFHDGAGDMILVKEGMGYRFYSGDLKFRMDSVSPQSDGRLRIGGEYFYRLDRDTTLEDWGVLEQLLFAGHYQRPGVTTGTVFHPNGQVEGLDSFYYYAAVIDYSDFYNRYDRVRLGGDPKHLQTYAFRIRQDTMMIYALDCRHYDQNHECDSEVLGDRLYALPGGGRWN